MLVWVSSPVHRNLITALVRARKDAGLTQRDLAARLGKPPSFVGKVESIERNISLLEFVAWTKAIGIRPEDVLNLVEETEKVEI